MINNIENTIHALLHGEHPESKDFPRNDVEYYRFSIRVSDNQGHFRGDNFTVCQGQLKAENQFLKEVDSLKYGVVELWMGAFRKRTSADDPNFHLAAFPGETGAPMWAKVIAEYTLG